MLQFLQWLNLLFLAVHSNFNPSNLDKKVTIAHELGQFSGSNKRGSFDMILVPLWYIF